MKIGIDVDGVIIDYMKVARAYAELHDLDILKKEGVINKEAFRIKDRYNWSKEEVEEFGNKYFVKLTSETPFLPLASEMLIRLEKEGFQLNIISNRGLLHKEASEVATKMIEDKNIKISNYYWVKDKIKICLENEIKIIVDDSYDICKEATENKIYAIYFREKGFPKIDSEYVYDVDNWVEAYRRIKEIEKKV